MYKEATVLLDFFPEKVYQSDFIAYPDKIIALYQSLEGTKVIQYAALLDDKGILVTNRHPENRIFRSHEKLFFCCGI
jgi:hypothetical protein